MQKASVWAEKVMIPTYEIGEAEKNPIFLEKRVYQGSCGKVYPYPTIEKISDEKKDKEYTAVWLENEYIRVMVLPELGGRIQRAYDKTNDYDFVYYNQVIKPALVGLTGPWISGGIEFNWPQHHRPTTFLPVDYEIQENEDGSVSVLCHDVDQMYGTKGLMRISVYPGKAYIEIKGQLYNRTSLPQTFLWWANPAVPVNDNTQSIFPPDVHAVMDHGKRDVSRFPIATGVYYKKDYSEGVDISRYKNIPVPTSYMAEKSKYDFVGGYDYGKHAGILHVADHHVSPGKKQWTWGCGDFGKAWDRNLTDEDGPYVELMTGMFTDNQPDFTWLKPFEEKTSVRIRVDGQLLDYVVLQKSLHQNLIARVKILGQMDIAEKRLPQDGHFRTRIANRDVNIRTSVIPTVFGEKAVLRLLASGNMVADAETFGMNQAHFEQFSKMLEAPNGMIYITGPTGSGKTTTLYMALQKLSNRKVNIATIEDPVEWNIPRVNQCQVNTVAGLTFERGLRSLLRQDPDIIMVGETRDEETAAISVRAAITGHLVFSTLHTNDAVSSIIRLIDMGVEPYMVANSLVGLVAQRLVRVVCPECGYWDEPTEQEKAFIGPKITRVRRAQGCNSCSHTGYVGRRAIHEILCVDNQMRRMITQRTPMEELRSYATHYLGMESLTDEALKLVADGTTTVEELKKVAYYI